MEKYDENDHKIFVDADACPVKAEICDIAKKYSVPVIYVASYAHSTSLKYGGEWKYVDCDKEAADLYIVNHASQNDLVVTQDLGLASMLMSKHVDVISPRGKIYSEQDMDTSLYLRFLSAKERRSGHYSKGPKPFTNSDRNHFINNLQKMLSKLAGIKS